MVGNPSPTELGTDCPLLGRSISKVLTRAEVEVSLPSRHESRYTSDHGSESDAPHDRSRRRFRAKFARVRRFSSGWSRSWACADPLSKVECEGDQRPCLPESEHDENNQIR